MLQHSPSHGMTSLRRVAAKRDLAAHIHISHHNDIIGGGRRGARGACAGLTAKVEGECAARRRRGRLAP
ncbi:hypothetical protein JYU34_018780 [Plutella xylostella]|uniref:Uncharacterized protein n=1 Tax=Plutella xylostella TaxID=51655 RepID=A0ABQ7PYG6_PLUXY|nr:hypothetical protein JYU34_018780 [Plutella xylostella]